MFHPMRCILCFFAVKVVDISLLFVRWLSLMCLHISSTVVCLHLSGFLLLSVFSGEEFEFWIPFSMTPCSLNVYFSCRIKQKRTGATSQNSFFSPCVYRTQPP